MVIQQSQVNMYSQSQFTFEHSSETSVQLHYGEANNNETEDSLKEAFRIDFQQTYSASISTERMVYNYEENMSVEDQVKKMIIEKLLKRLYGEDAHIPFYPAKKPVHAVQNAVTAPLNPYKKQETQDQELKAMVFQTHEEYYQKQTIDFSASLKIQTPNQTFEMNIELSFSQELYASRSSQIVIGDERFIDPLIINYDKDVNPFENISNLRFEFDLDNDGKTEMIPLLVQGAGFLALDKNNNGTIDNGNELFGPQTNNGFEELAQYDTDKNNWIDENDAVFDRLKVWSKNDQGKSELVSLIDRNVGAIYLGEVQSGFKYQTEPFQTDAVQKSNGVFVKEDGSGVGVVNSIDVVV